MLRQLTTGNFLFTDKGELYVLAESVAQDLSDFVKNVAKYLSAGTAIHVTKESISKLNNLTKDITSLS